MSISTPPLADSSAMDASIRYRAEQLYEQSGRLPGHDEENWLKAEAEVKNRTATPDCGKRAFLLIKARGITYTAAYDPRTTDYRPGEFAGKPVRIRFEDRLMFITRPNGAVLEAVIVKQELT